MMNNYTGFEAKQIIEQGKRFSYFKLFFDPIYNFLLRFVYRKGYLDGWRGFVLSYLMAIYHFTIWVKVWETE